MRILEETTGRKRQAHRRTVPGPSVGRVAHLVLVVVGVAAVLLGAGPGLGVGLAAPESPVSVTSPLHPVSRGSAPTRLRIPAIDVNSPMMALGLRYDGSLQVPPDAFTSGWYVGGPRPGTLGPAVIAAHVHWNGRWGVFQHLADLNYGDRINVDRRDGSTAVFRVTRVSRFTKTRFPTMLVYGNINHPGLRLVTCDGFSATQHAYLDNVVVFAMLIPPPRSP